MSEKIKIVAIALLSSVATLLLYRWIAPPVHVVWEDHDGQARYASVVDKIFNGRSGGYLPAAAPTSFTNAAELSTPAVVNIKALLEVDGGLFRGGTMTGSSGSGVIMSPDGYIVTNHHVVENSTDIKVTMADKREYKAKLIGSDPSTDIALLKVSAGGLPFLLFGDSDSLRVGEWVLAVGNPFNLTSTVTAGIVSAKGRNINILGGGASIESFIQTDAAVNPGNSGGALVNSGGELIGINTAIITESGNYEGYSFAVPSNLVKKIVRDLREFGTVQRAYLGIGIEDLTNDEALQLGLPNAQGVYVNRVSARGAADDAGLKPGDVVISINQALTKSTSELQEIIGRLRPGDKVEVEFWRNNRRQRTQIVLKDSSNSTSTSKYRGDELRNDLGIELRPLNKAEQGRLGLTGVVVTSIQRGSIVFETNMQPGFILTKVNGSRVNDLAETIEAIQNANNNLILDGYYEGEEDLYSYRFKKR